MKNNKMFFVIFCVGGVVLVNSPKSLNIPKETYQAALVRALKTDTQVIVPKDTQEPVSKIAQTEIPVNNASVGGRGQVSTDGAKSQGWWSWATDVVAYAPSAVVSKMGQMIRYRRQEAERSKISNVLWNSFNHIPTDGFDLIVRLNFFSLNELSFKQQIEEISGLLVAKYNRESGESVTASTWNWLFGMMQQQEEKEKTIKLKYSPRAVIEKIQELCNEKNYSNLVLNFKALIKDRIALYAEPRCKEEAKRHFFRCDETTNLPESECKIRAQGKFSECKQEILKELESVAPSLYSKRLKYIIEKVLLDLSNITKNFAEVMASDQSTIYDLKISTYQEFALLYKDLFDLMEKVKQELK